MKNSFNVVVYSRRLFDTPEACSEIVEQLCSQPQFMPDMYGIDEPINNKFNCKQTNDVVQIFLNKEHRKNFPEQLYGEILFKKTKPKGFYSIKWSRRKYVPFGVSTYSIASSYIKKKNNLANWLNFLFPLLNTQDTWFAYFCLEDEERNKHKFEWITPKNTPIDTGYTPGLKIESYIGNKLEENIPGVYWGTYFGPQLKQLLGTEKFTQLPHSFKYDFDYGGTFLASASIPFDWGTGESKQIQKQVVQTLGKQYFFDSDTLRYKLEHELGVGEIYDPSQMLPEVTNLKSYLVD